MYLDQLKTQFETLQMVPPQLVVPCTEDEVHQLEQTLGLRLPLAYREFLLWMGHYAGGYLAGYDWRFEALFHLKEWALELLEENQSTEILPEDAIVFFMNQGYRFMFFRVSEGENPPVYEYSEIIKPRRFRLVFQQFSEFVSYHLEEARQHIEKVKSDISELRKSRPGLAQGIVDLERAHGFNL